MAAQTTMSGLAKKFGGRLDGYIAKHAGDETDYGFQRLPAPIQNGIARVTKCYFDEYKTGTNKGEYYMRCEAVVVSPVMFPLPDGSEIKIAGLTTSVMFPMCQTTNSKGEVTTQDENIGYAMNMLRMLGADTTTVKTVPQLETVAAAVAKAGVYTKFTTSVREPRPGTNDKPGTWENWQGNKGLETYNPPDQAASGVTDESAVAESAGHAATNGTTEYTDQGDLDSLLALAEGGDTNAQHTLQEMAEKAGVRAEFDAFETWAEGVELLKGSTSETPAEETQPEPEKKVDPAPKMMYKYKPVTKGPGGKDIVAKKAIDCEVIAVNKIKRVASLKNMVDNKTVYTNVPWDSLE